MTERDFAHVVEPHHDHPRHPEEEDVVPRLEHRGRVPVAQLLGLLRPAQRRVWPKPGREPRVEHIRVLLQFFRPALRAFAWVHDERILIAARLAAPDRNAMAPPQLARDAPIADVLHPVVIHTLEPPGDHPNAAVFNSIDRRARQRLHPHEPLLAEHRLDDRPTALAMPDRMPVRLDLLDQPQPLKVGDDDLAAFEAVHSLVRPRLGVHRAVACHRDDRRQAVSLANLEVDRVVPRRDLERSGPELRVYRLIRNNRDLALDDRQQRFPPDDLLPSLHARVHRDRHVRDNRLRPRSGDDDVLVRHVARFVQQRIADVPETSLNFFVLYLEIRERRLAAWAPVDDPLAPVDQPLVVQLRERRSNGQLRAFIHREDLAVPITRGAQPGMLVRDHAPILAHPLPHPLHELLPSQVVP